MSIGYIMLLGALLGFAMLGIFHKVADHPSCRPRAIALTLFFWAGIFTGFYTLIHDPNGLHIPPKVLFIGSAGGLLSAIAIFTFQTGLKFGKISTSWLVLNLSMSVPVLISIFFFEEKLNWIKITGIALVLIAILMMWRDKKIDLEKAGIDSAGHASGQHTKWLSLMIFAFLCNGLSASTQKILIEAGEKDYTWQFYTTLFCTAFLITAAFSLMTRNFPHKRELATGFVMAIGSVAGNVLITLALGHGVEAAVAFPVGNGGSLTLVVLAGVLFFKERVHPAGRIGIVCGICAILLLVMEPQILNLFQKEIAVR
jgi:drug/metabolite transporter (DMT)-like permease